MMLPFQSPPSSRSFASNDYLTPVGMPQELQAGAFGIKGLPQFMQAGAGMPRPKLVFAWVGES